MRLYLLPISTRRTLLYAQRLNIQTKDQKAGLVSKWTGWAAKTWATWEKKESGWQRKVVDWGNGALQRVPFEEWGLKSVPALSARRRKEELEGREKVELVFPGTVIPTTKAEGIARALAVDRQPLHRRKLLWCFVGLPISIPFFIVPIIPNLPLYYIGYRAWSHWKAISGGKHVQWLIQHKLLSPAPSPVLDKLYDTQGTTVDDSPNAKERLLLTKKQIRSMSETLDVPSLEIELERAVWQVENSLQEAKGQEPEDKALMDEEEKTKKKGQ